VILVAAITFCHCARGHCRMEGKHFYQFYCHPVGR